VVPGRRERLIELFEGELISPQENAGMHVLGQFRSPSEPDTFIWLRGFVDRASRPAALSGFYDGPVWSSRRDAANASIADSDNVILLRPLAGDDRHPLDPSARLDRRPLTLAVQPVPADCHCELAAVFGHGHVSTSLRDGVIALFLSDLGPNNWPRLPVRADGPFFVWLNERPTLLSPDGPAGPLARLIASMTGTEPELLDLSPTAVSLRRARGRSETGTRVGAR
jgi:hypothetical protein